jgi:hypothetical protein
MPCQIVGLNDKQLTGRLTFFVPEKRAHVQLPPARTRRCCVSTSSAR